MGSVIERRPGDSISNSRGETIPLESGCIESN